jgi:hypothetical protein
MVFWNSFDESQAAYNESHLKFYIAFPMLVKYGVQGFHPRTVGTAAITENQNRTGLGIVNGAVMDSPVANRITGKDSSVMTGANVYLTAFPSISIN